VVGFIGHFYTRHVSTSNYSANAYLHKSPTHPLSIFLPVVSSAVPEQGLLTVEILQLHSLKSSLHRLPHRTDSELTLSRHGPHRNHSSSIVALVSVVTGMNLRSICPETVAIYRVTA
jgi:hypothetical protein